MSRWEKTPEQKSKTTKDDRFREKGRQEWKGKHRVHDSYAGYEKQIEAKFTSQLLLKQISILIRSQHQPCTAFCTLERKSFTAV